MMQLAQITAHYSSAVLVAVLPYISNFARKLDLPVPVPVTANQVLEFKCDPRQGKVGGLVILTNGCRFTFLDGRVCIYRSPQSFFSLQDPDLTPHFYGPVKVKPEEALRIAREVIQKLGYTEDPSYVDAAPQITPPKRIGTNLVARYRFSWVDSNSPLGKSAGNLTPVAFDMEVDASTGQIQMVSINSPNTRRPSPKVDVSPSQPRPDAPKEQPLSGGIQTQPVNPVYAAAFLEALLPQLSDFAAKLGLPLELPLTSNQVDLLRYHCRAINGQPMVQLFLKNGDRFNYGHGHVTDFYAHDAYRKFPEYGKPEDFLGKINMSTNEAIKLCERSMKKLGLKAKLPKPLFAGAVYVGKNELSRYVFFWPNPSDPIAVFEVDMEGKAIKSAYLDHPSLWREPPRIEAPITLPPPQRTNAAPSKSAEEPQIPLKPPSRPFTPFDAPSKR